MMSNAFKRNDQDGLDLCYVTPSDYLCCKFIGDRVHILCLDYPVRT